MDLKYFKSILIQLCGFKWFDKYVQLVGFNKYCYHIAR